MREVTRIALADRLSAYDSVVEIGIGRRPDLAGELAKRGVRVTATDIRPRETPPGVTFAVDDVTEPSIDLYAGADALVGLNLPPELQGPTARLADQIDAELLFTTLGSDPATVPASAETLPGETLFVYEKRDPGGQL